MNYHSAIQLVTKLKLLGNETKHLHGIIKLMSYETTDL